MATTRSNYALLGTVSAAVLTCAGLLVHWRCHGESGALAVLPERAAATDGGGPGAPGVAPAGAEQKRRQTSAGAGAAPAIPTSPPGWVRVVQDDGRPAAGASLTGAERSDSIHERSFRREAVDWSIRANARGELALERARAVGSIAAVRLADCAMAVVPFDATPGAEHVVPALLDQAFLATGIPEGEEVELELGIQTTDIVSFALDRSNPRGDWAPRFADRYLPGFRALDAPVVLAKTTLHLGSRAARASVSIPRATYRVEVVECTFGFWVRGFRAEVTGEPIEVPLERVPIARLVDPLARSRAADRVALFVERLRDGTRTTFEVDLPWRLRDGEIQAAITWRSKDPLGLRCALSVTWTSGEKSRTPLVPWPSLGGFHALPDGERGGSR